MRVKVGRKLVETGGPYILIFNFYFNSFPNFTWGDKGLFVNMFLRLGSLRFVILLFEEEEVERNN
jgi:hypothetical protein